LHVLRSFRYPLHPNAAQEHVLEDWRKGCCSLHNGALEQRIVWWRQKRSVTYEDQTAGLTELRAVDPAWEAPPVEVLRSALQRLDKSFAAFFRRCKNGEKPGFPRFRSSRRYDSFSIGRVSVKKDRVHVPKLGHVKMNLYRPIEGTIRNVIIKRDATGKWWVIFQCDLGPAPAKCEVKTKVGIDLGLTTLATLSTGETIENPRFAKHAAQKLTSRQQKLAKKKKGSKNRERQRVLVAKAHAHVANQRLDHARKEAKKLFDTYDEVQYEDLNISTLAGGMFAKSFADASWGILLRCCTSIAEYAGKHLTPKDARGTSQRCCRCGAIVPKTLADRVHRCHHCGLVIDRDHNAAINVLNARPGRSGADKARKGASVLKEKLRLEARPLTGR
jgi:putative transposase